VKRIVFALVPLFFAGAAPAETGFQLGLPNWNAPPDPNVKGVRFSFLWGKNQSTRGLDFGALSLSQTDRASGVAFIGGVHYVRQEMSNGVVFSVMNYHTGRDSGLNGGFVNVLSDTSKAFNIGFITYVEGPTLVDLGGINVSRSSKAQIGFVNVTDRIDSFQFGFLNFADNGFLPIFPVFNFPGRR
jgi:hypothetical protein